MSFILKNRGKLGLYITSPPKFFEASSCPLLKREGLNRLIFNDFIILFTQQLI